VFHRAESLEFAVMNDGGEFIGSNDCDNIEFFSRNLVFKGAFDFLHGEMVVLTEIVFHWSFDID